MRPRWLEPVVGPLDALLRLDAVRRWRDQRAPESVAFDAEHGTDTARFDWGNYEPTLPAVAGRVLDALERLLGPEETAKATFVDLGCGKGRVLLLAAQRPFARVVGVELDPRLVAVAERNVAAWSVSHGLTPPAVVWADAAEVPLQGDPLVLYLYNPFPAEVLDRVLRRFRGRQTVIAYVHPVDRNLVEAHGFRPLMVSLEDPSWIVYRGSARHPPAREPA